MSLYFILFHSFFVFTPPLLVQSPFYRTPFLLHYSRKYSIDTPK
nr:MAG TPA: hypothetical protein [Caudoviricetes sp.]